MTVNATRWIRTVGIVGLLAAIGPGCGDDSGPSTPEIIFSDSFEENGSPTAFKWRPMSPDFPAAIVSADCPGGGSWALELTANDPVYRYPRVDVFLTIPEIQDGDILEFSAWVKSSRRSARAYIEFCFVDHDLIACYRTESGTSTNPQWTRVSVFMPIRIRPMDSLRIALDVSTNSPGEAPVLFDRVELKRIGNSRILDGTP